MRRDSQERSAHCPPVATLLSAVAQPTLQVKAEEQMDWSSFMISWKKKRFIKNRVSEFFLKLYLAFWLELLCVYFKRYIGFSQAGGYNSHQNLTREKKKKKAET